MTSLWARETRERNQLAKTEIRRLFRNPVPNGEDFLVLSEGQKTLTERARIRIIAGPNPWGHSSVGRALEWHSRGRRFDPDWLHHLAPVGRPNGQANRESEVASKLCFGARSDPG